MYNNLQVNNCFNYVIRSFLFVFLNLLFVSPLHALSSANIPLDSPLYLYLEKLAGMGLVTSDLKGVRPYSKAEAARLVAEAEQKLAAGAPDSRFARELIARVREVIPRETALRQASGRRIPLLDYNPVSSLRMRSVYMDGAPRSYDRLVHDPGDDGVFGIGSGLRPPNSYPSPAQQRGTEGTPLLENNNGVVHPAGTSGEVRWAAEAYLRDKASALVEPALLISRDDAKLSLNRGYVKLGGGAVELEVGKDENWFGLGYRGSITLGSNAENFTQVKLSSPEPFRVGWLSWLGDLKYALAASRFDKTVTGGVERQPWFYAVKLVSKPTDNLEIGFNLGRQVGGPGVNNSVGDTIRGLIGGTNADNSNGLAGFEARYRIPWLRNAEVYGEFSGEDTAGFWPIVESYLAGFFIPNLTADGRNDLRFEFFQGNQILYSHSTFPGGYIYKGMPVGHPEGGATQDVFTRYSHWFGARHNLALEYIYTTRGMIGKIGSQVPESKHAGRVIWSLPVRGEVDARLTYGIEMIENVNLAAGRDRTNQLGLFELRYRY